MKTSLKYLLLIATTSSLTALLLYGLFRKYSIETLSHLYEGCMQLVKLFWPLNAHTIGLGILLILGVISLIFASKTIFSVLKTWLKIESLMANKLLFIPSKISNLISSKTATNEIVVVESNKQMAFSYGFLKSKIIISTKTIDLLSPKELEAVILHELHHVKNLHTTFIVMSEIVKSTLFFIPLLSLLIARLKRAFEQDANNEVIRIQGHRVFLDNALNTFSKGSALNMQYVSPFSNVSCEPKYFREYFSSALVFLVLITLYVYPNVAHAKVTDSLTDSSVCAPNQCTSSRHCYSDAAEFSQTSQGNFSDGFTPVSLVSTQGVY